MVRPTLKFEPGENPSPEELLDELQQRPGTGVEEEPEDEFSGEEDAGTEEPDVGDQPQEPDADARQGRRSSGQRLKELRDQARAEAERAANAERELFQLRTQQEAYRNQQQQWDRQREEQSLADLPWEQQVEHKLRKAQEDNDRQLKQIQFQNIVNQDKAEFTAKCAGDPDRRRLAQVVEQTYYQSINAGRYIPRDEVFRWALGKEVEEQRAAQQNKRRSATPQAQAQRVRPPNSRSDNETSRSRGSGRANETLAQREKRLENIRF